MFQNRWPADQRRRRQQVRPGRGADQSVGRDRRGAALRRGQPEPDLRTDPAARNVTQILVDHQMALENVLHVAPNAIANYDNIYYPERRRGDRSVLVGQLREPGVVLLRADRRRREHHRARDGETLRAVPRSGAAAAELQQPSVPDQPVPEACRPSRTGSSTPTRSWRREVQGPATRPSRRRRCRPTPASAMCRRRPVGTAPPAAGTVRRHDDAPATRRRRCSPARRFRAAQHRVDIRRDRRRSTGCCCRRPRRRPPPPEHRCCLRKGAAS